MATTTDDMTAHAVPTGETTAAWRRALPALLVALAALVGLYWDTALSILSIWERSETFAHGYVIVPISAWLIWRRRDALARVRPKPSYLAAGLILLAGFGWLLAHAVGVLVVEQLAFVAMIPLTVWALLGWGVAREILFPLAFLFFAVPMGEELISPLMDFTAVFAITMLRLTGIPVYVDGNFFTIPSGSWSVVEACSGLRYLIASITLGTLYAYLTYRSYWRRAIFIALSTVVPIFANGMRAYIIVMIGHLSDMQLAHGIDHFIYGWVWFGIVMMVLFWLGSYWREDEPAGEHPHSNVAEPPGGSAREQAPSHQGTDSALADVPANGPGAPAAATSASRSATVGASLLANLGVRSPSHAPVLTLALLTTVAAAALAPLMSGLSAWAAHRGPGSIALQVPAPAGAWASQPDRLSDWEPRYLGMDATEHRTYRDHAGSVGLYLAYYGGLKQGQELINSQNVLVVQKHPKWRMPSQGRRTVSLAGRPTTVLEAVLRSEGRDLLVWRWDWVSGDVTVSPVVGKLLQARDRLLLRTPSSAGVVAYTPLDGAPEEERQTLQRFLDAMLPSIERTLTSAGES
jgi:exosortase A